MQTDCTRDKTAKKGTEYQCKRVKNLFFAEVIRPSVMCRLVPDLAVVPLTVSVLLWVSEEMCRGKIQSYESHGIKDQLAMQIVAKQEKYLN